MPNWISENAFLPFITGLLLTGMLGSFAVMLRSRTLVLLAAILGICSIALIVAERYIVTDRERVKDLLYEVANAVQFNQHDSVLASMKEGSRAYQAAQPEMERYDFRTCNITGVRELTVNEDTTPLTAMINFVVYVDVNAPSYQHDGPGRREVTLWLEKQSDGRWLITNYDHRTPTGGAKL